MHQMSPGVERAVAGARAWANRLGCPAVHLTHLLLALLDEEEGRPAALLESVGVAPIAVRERLVGLADSPVAPPDSVLFTAARNWSLAYRHDPEFLTDAFLIVVLRADPAFERWAAGLGLDASQLEARLIRNRDAAEGSEPTVESPSGIVTPPDAAGEHDAARILDANFNRAREAARVLEDYCRFVLDDRVLTEEAKAIRHGLAVSANRIPAPLLLTARETLRDVGTTITAGGEYERASPAQVAMVNAKRLQESLRSLEEFGKLFGPELGRELESLRYRAYTLERVIGTGLRARERLAAARLYVLLSGSDCRGTLDWTIARAAAGGADVIQLREKGLPDRELLSRAREVREWTRMAGILFMVNDRPDMARLVDADGVHLGQDDLSVKDARRIVGPDLLIGMSTHTPEQVRQAVQDGADYLGAGPVFPSKTKAFNQYPGLEFVRAAAELTSLPLFALGGITAASAEQVVRAGVRRIAVSAAVAQADDPELAARDLRAALERSEQSAE
jgi:thiamine-phosphate pyrophosphorylase